MIRTTLASDTPALLALSEATGAFKPIEIQALREVLDDYHSSMKALGHRSVSYVLDGQPGGFAYYAPAAMTDRTWYLYWIVVDVRAHGRGIGTELMQYVEADVNASRGRLLLIETSSMPHYDSTRRFYAKLGYECTATIKDYYADRDDMVVFRKTLRAFPE
jgi:ribosomal protein S18 acetylase RimI-like enzyme